MSEGAPEGLGGSNSGENPPTPPSSGGNPSGTGQNDDAAQRIAHLENELRKARAWEDRYKQIKPKAEKFDEIEQSRLSVEERAQAAIQAAKDEVSSAKGESEATKRELAIFKAGVKYKIGEEDLVFLQGVPVDQLDKAAENLAKRLGISDIPNFDGGPRNSPPRDESMGDFLFREINKARRR